MVSKYQKPYMTLLKAMTHFRSQSYDYVMRNQLLWEPSPHSVANKPRLAQKDQPLRVRQQSEDGLLPPFWMR